MKGTGRERDGGGHEGTDTLKMQKRKVEEGVMESNGPVGWFVARKPWNVLEEARTRHEGKPLPSLLRFIYGPTITASPCPAPPHSFPEAICTLL